MLIKFFCPNGHKLSADEKQAGRNAKCPKCESKVIIPEPIKQRVSDTSVLGILGDFDLREIPLKPAETKPTSTGKPRRVCSKCSTVIEGSYRVCPKCNVYLGN